MKTRMVICMLTVVGLTLPAAWAGEEKSEAEDEYLGNDEQRIHDELLEKLEVLLQDATWMTFEPGGLSVEEIEIRRGDQPRPERPGRRGGPRAPVRRPGRQQGAWLGVKVGPVPPALAHNLGLKSVGLMVRNVAKNSPADKAGIGRYDVIVAIGGKKISGDVAQLTRNLRRRRPGEAIKLTIIHKTRKKNVPVRLAKPLPPGKMKYKYQDKPKHPDIVIWPEHVLPPGVRPGPKMRAKPIHPRTVLVDPKLLEGFKRQVRQARQRAKGQDFERLAQRTRQAMERFKRETRQAMERFEREMREALDGRSPARRRPHGIPGPGMHVPGGRPHGMPKPGMHAPKGRPGGMSRPAMRGAKGRPGGMPGPAMHAPKGRRQVQPRERRPQMSRQRVQYYFIVNENGAIEVHLVNREGKLTLRFRNERDFKTKSPKLHVKYRRLLGAE